MNKLLILVLSFGLLSCSKTPNDYVHLKLSVDSKNIIDQKREGKGLSHLSELHQGLLRSAQQACDAKEADKKQALEALRQLLVSSFGMTTSASIELVEFHSGQDAKSSRLMSRTSNLRISFLLPGNFSCESEIRE